jgi:PAS domain S-box-containing protein
LETPAKPRENQTRSLVEVIEDLRLHQIELEVQNDELRTAQRVIETSRQKYFQLFDLAPVGYLRLDAEGAILDLNLMAAELLGRPRRLLLDIKTRMVGFLATESLDLLATHLRQVFSMAEPQTCTLRLIRRDQSSVLVRAQSVRIVDDAGRIICLSSLTDITELVSAQQAMRESERRFRELFEHQGEGVIIITANASGRTLTIHDVNPAACRLTGRQKTDVIGQALYAALPGFRLIGLAEVLARVLRSGMAQEIAECLYQDNRASHWAEYHVYPLPSGELVVIIRDVSRRRQSVDALRASEEKYRNLFLNAVEGIFQSTPDGRYLNVNPAFARMFGFDSPKRIISEVRDIADQIYAYPEERARFQRILESQGIVKGFELQAKRRDGALVWVSINAKVIRDPDGVTAFYEGTVEDISERKRLEEERIRIEARLRQQQKLESIGTLAGGVAHEINNPINGILNYAQLVIDLLEPDHPATAHAAEIIKETERVTLIVRNLLRFARQEPQSHHWIEVREIIEATLSLVHTIIRHDQIILQVDIADDLPRLLCRSQQIQQVLMNLLTNARDALNERYPDAHPDKVVRLIAERADRGENHWIRLTIEDHGIGIADPIKDRIFDPFFTTKPRDKGTGLGLSISHGIVKDHHGTLRFEADPGRYTRFHVELPVETAVAPGVAAPHAGSTLRELSP